LCLRDQRIQLAEYRRNRAVRGSRIGHIPDYEREFSA
jgi:hypothetical protein